MDEGGHPARIAVTTVREKPRAIGDRAQAAARDRGDPARSQTLAGQ
jgi:hypothetical protein